VLGRVNGRWRVVEHADRVVVVDARFVVRKGGRARVLAERRKNVHAWVEGTRVAPGAPEAATATAAVRYDPYRAPWFEVDGQPIVEAAVVVFDRGCFAG
jgi:hypothetical protein